MNLLNGPQKSVSKIARLGLIVLSCIVLVQSTSSQNANSKTHAKATAGVCTQSLDKADEMGDAFVSVPADINPGNIFASRIYTCTGLTKNALVQGSITGTFEFVSPDKKAGWVEMKLIFQNQPHDNGIVGDIEECYGADVKPGDPSHRCVATDDPDSFSIPITNGNWKTINPPPSTASGFSDSNGVAVLRVYAARAEYVNSHDHNQQAITAKRGASITIKQMN